MEPSEHTILPSESKIEYNLTPDEALVLAYIRDIDNGEDPDVMRQQIENTRASNTAGPQSMDFLSRVMESHTAALNEAIRRIKEAKDSETRTSHLDEPLDENLVQAFMADIRHGDVKAWELRQLLTQPSTIAALDEAQLRLQREANANQ